MQQPGGFRAQETALCHLSAVKDKFGQILDRFAHTKAEHLNVHGHLDLLAQIARPVFKGKGKVAGLKLENTRLMRLLEVLLRRAGGGFGGWRTDQLRASILDGFGLQPHEYSRNQIRYDLRKLAAHGIIERIERSYSYALSARGQKTAILLTLFTACIRSPFPKQLGPKQLMSAE